MKLQPEVVNVLEREKKVCESAISQIQETLRPYEEEHGLYTDQFLQMFDSGKLEDYHAYFRWYAQAKALEDWRKTKQALHNLLSGLEQVDA